MSDKEKMYRRQLGGAEAALRRERQKVEQLEALLKDVWATYSEKAESSFHPAWEVDSELADRIHELGIGVSE